MRMCRWMKDKVVRSNLTYMFCSWTPIGITNHGMIEFSGIMGMRWINCSRLDVSNTDVKLVAFDEGSKVLVTKDHGIFERVFDVVPNHAPSGLGSFANEVIRVSITELTGGFPGSNEIPSINQCLIQVLVRFRPKRMKN